MLNMLINLPDAPEKDKLCTYYKEAMDGDAVDSTIETDYLGRRWTITFITLKSHIDVDKTFRLFLTSCKDVEVRKINEVWGLQATSL
jgi:hypothetical protein